MNEKHKILIMNEASAPGNFVARMLEANGYLLLYSAGGEFPDTVSTEAPAVALFDLTVKDGNALESMRRLNMRSPGTECIMLADHTSHESAIEAVRLGAYFYLPKPYEPGHLLLVIRRAIEKRQAAEAWAENEEKHRVLMDNIRDPIMLYDCDGVLLSANVAAAELLETTPDAIVGKTLHAVHPDTADANLEMIRRVMESGTAIESERERKLSAGTRTFLSTFHPVRDSQGEITAVQVIEYDITGNQRTTCTTGTAERPKTLLHNGIHHSEDGIIITDMNGIVLLANEPAAALLGKRTSELLGQPLGVLVVAGEKIEMGILRELDKLGTGKVSVVATECDGRPVYLVSIRDGTGRPQKPEAISSEKTVSR